MQFPASVSISPVARDSLLQLLSMAKKEIWIGSQYLSNSLVNQKLLELAKTKKIKINLLLSDFCYFGRPSESKVKQLMAQYSAFSEAGISTKLFNKKLKIMGKPAYYHAKVIVIDRKLAWMGSINNSIDSFEMNREFGIFFSGKSDIKFLQKSIEQDFNDPLVQTWDENIKCAM